MAIKNPYSTMEHRTFKRTFLQQTEVLIKFTPALSNVAFRSRMIPYLKTIFNLDLAAKADAEANHAEIRSDNEQKQFIFDLDQAKFVIGAQGYKSFAETAVPMIGMLQRFMSDVVKSNSISQLSIVKVNLWPINSGDAYSNFTNMIRYTFKERCVADMLSYKFDENPTPVRLSKTSNNEIEKNIRLDAVLSAEVLSKEKVQLGLVLNAVAENVSSNDMLSDSVVLNDIVYQGFIETVTDNVFDLMSREDL